MATTDEPQRNVSPGVGCSRPSIYADGTTAIGRFRSIADSSSSAIALPLET